MPGTAISTENHAGICRITCGWKKPALPLDAVRRYWRDVHSPAIARRPGIWEYRHYQYDAVRPLFDLADVEQGCPADEQLMWLSDVRYADDAALAVFAAEPGDQVRGELLGDIDLIVDQSTTYKAIDAMARTLIDDSALIPPQGRAAAPGLRPLPAQPHRPRTRSAPSSSISPTAGRTRPGVRPPALQPARGPRRRRRARRRAIRSRRIRPNGNIRRGSISRSTTTRCSPTLDTVGLADHVQTIHAYPVAANYTSNYAGQADLRRLARLPGLGRADRRSAATTRRSRRSWAGCTVPSPMA